MALVEQVGFYAGGVQKWGIEETTGNFIPAPGETPTIGTVASPITNIIATAQTLGSQTVTGAIGAGTTVTGGTGVIATTGNVTATAGNVVATVGAVSAGTTVTGGTGVTATTGNVTATAGDVVATVGAVSAGTTVTAGTGVTATTGNVTATAGNVVATVGSVSAGTTVTAGTGVTATTGNVTATAGNVSAGVALLGPAMTLTSAVGSMSWRQFYNEEEVTLSLVAAFTDSVGNLLPANSLIQAVGYRVTADITGAAPPATQFTIGTAASAARFAAADAVLTVHSGLGLAHHVLATLNYYQAAAAPVRITLDQIPATGRIRICVAGIQFVAPTA